MSQCLLYRILTAILLLLISFTGLTLGQENRIQAWTVSDDLTQIMNSLPLDLDSSLPAPRMLPEPPFTRGVDNTVYWYGDSVRTWAVENSMKLLFFEIEASYDDVELWAPVPSRMDSAVFKNLPLGVRIEYRLRYFTQDTLGQYWMSFWSDIVWSIQDDNPPILYLVEIVGLQTSGDIDWVIGPTIQLRVQASDPDGQVMQIVIHEQSASENDTLFHPLEPPSDSVDTTIPYTIRSPAHELVTLSVWIIDVSGQDIGDYSHTFFWWPDDEAEDKMVCFPNPFNPEIDGVTTIKVNDPRVDEARIFDPFGNHVRTLQKTAVTDISFEWDGKNGRGDAVATGGYICVAVGNTRLYCKIAVLR